MACLECPCLLLITLTTHGYVLTSSYVLTPSDHHNATHHQLLQDTDREPHQVQGCHIRPSHVPHGCVLSGHLRSTMSRGR